MWKKKKKWRPRRDRKAPLPYNRWTRRMRGTHYEWYTFLYLTQKIRNTCLKFGLRKFKGSKVLKHLNFKFNPNDKYHSDHRYFVIRFWFKKYKFFKKYRRSLFKRPLKLYWFKYGTDLLFKSNLKNLKLQYKKSTLSVDPFIVQLFKNSDISNYLTNVKFNRIGQKDLFYSLPKSMYKKRLLTPLDQAKIEHYRKMNLIVTYIYYKLGHFWPVKNKTNYIKYILKSYSYSRFLPDFLSKAFLVNNEPQLNQITIKKYEAYLCAIKRSYPLFAADKTMIDWLRTIAHELRYEFSCEQRYLNNKNLKCSHILTNFLPRKALSHWNILKQEIPTTTWFKTHKLKVSLNRLMQNLEKKTFFKSKGIFCKNIRRLRPINIILRKVVIKFQHKKWFAKRTKQRNCKRAYFYYSSLPVKIKQLRSAIRRCRKYYGKK
jgi:hypothetical protein